MNNPELYSLANNLQKRDSYSFLNKYFDKIKWLPNGGDTILDIGCGDGNITAEILLSKLPQNINKLIGVDISKDMIEYASNTYNNPKLKFAQLNIETEQLPNEYVKNFDHIFSFFCLHWVQKNHQAYKNIFDLLKPNGDMLLLFLVNDPLYDMYEVICKIPKWKIYMSDVNNHLALYRNSKHPDKDLQRDFEKVGFNVKVCINEIRSFIFNDFNAWKNFIKAVNPFMDRIPENLKDCYMEEFLNLTKSMNLIIPNTEEKVNLKYNIFSVYAIKE